MRVALAEEDTARQKGRGAQGRGRDTQRRGLGAAVLGNEPSYKPSALERTGFGPALLTSATLAILPSSLTRP